MLNNPQTKNPSLNVKRKPSTHKIKTDSPTMIQNHWNLLSTQNIHNKTKQNQTLNSQCNSIWFVEMVEKINRWIQSLSPLDFRCFFHLDMCLSSISPEYQSSLSKPFFEVPQNYDNEQKFVWLRVHLSCFICPPIRLKLQFFLLIDFVKHFANCPGHPVDGHLFFNAAQFLVK